MYGTVLLLRCCSKLESCGTVLLFYCCKLRSCIETERTSPILASSFIALSVVVFQNCSSDPMLRSRYKANSRYVSIEAYPFALPCGERIEGE